MPRDALDRYRRAAGLSSADLYLRYFALGGMSGPVEVDAMCAGALMPSPLDYDLLALALNERFLELGLGHPVPYSHSA
jgi:hypothetical protein